MTVHVLNADCLAALRDMPDASVDAVVTDPPRPDPPPPARDRRALAAALPHLNGESRD